MQKHVAAILTQAGVSPEDINIIDGIPETEQETFDVKPFVEKVRNNYQTQLQNDPAFFSDITIEKLPSDIKKKIESGQYARATNVTKEKLAKALGFSAEEIKDLEADDYKSLDYWVPAIAEKFQKTKAGDKQLQADLIAERKKNEGYQGLEETLRTKYETESNQKVSSAIFNAALIGELSSIQGLKIPASDIAATANNILQSKYAFERVGDFSVELRQKANPQMKVLKDGSSHELTLKEALQEIATERGWIEGEKEGASGSGKIKIEPGKNGTLQMIPPHLQDKISKKIAAEA